MNRGPGKNPVPMMSESASFWVGIVCAAIGILLIALTFPITPGRLDLSTGALVFAVFAAFLLSLELWRELKRPELRIFRIVLIFTALLASFRVIALSLEHCFQSKQAIVCDARTEPS